MDDLDVSLTFDQETLNTVSHLWLFQEDQQGHDSDTQKDHDEL